MLLPKFVVVVTLAVGLVAAWFIANAILLSREVAHEPISTTCVMVSDWRLCE